MRTVYSDLGIRIGLWHPVVKRNCDWRSWYGVPNVSQAQYELTSDGEHCQLGR